MTDSIFTAFISLVQYDQETSRLEGEAKEIKDALDQIDIQEQQLKAALATAQELVGSMRKQVHDKELELKTSEEKERAVREKMDNAKNEKEYQATTLELEVFEREQNELEGDLVGVWHQFEQTEAAYEKKKESTKLECEGLQEQREKKLKELARTRQEIDDRKSKAQEKQTLIPAHWLSTYLRMSSRVSDPVVPVQQGSCSVCFHLISNEDRNVLDRQELLQCKGCYRLLFVPTSQTESV